MKRHICQSKTKSGTQCKGNAMGGTYFCYVHQDSKDPVIKDPLKEAVRELNRSMTALILYRKLQRNR